MSNYYTRERIYQIRIYIYRFKKKKHTAPYTMISSICVLVLFCIVNVNGDVNKSNSVQRPNIIFILADDLGVGEIGLFPSDNVHGKIDTPNVDRLGLEGIQFTNAYAGYTVCAPSRTSLFTGRHSGNFLKHNLSGTAISPTEIKTLPRYLKSVGYNTALVGKSAPLASPIESGFDYFRGRACHT